MSSRVDLRGGPPGARADHPRHRATAGTRDRSGRDASRTRARLAAAAAELFSARGYDRTTLRDVGARAGVDPALVARYFDNKLGLYLAALRAESGEAGPRPLTERGRLLDLLGRSATLGSSPVLPAAVQPHGDPAVQRTVQAELSSRMVAPLEQRWASTGVADARRRAEVAAAAVIGVVLCRAAGTFDTLAADDPDDVATLLLDMLAQLGPPGSPPEAAPTPR